MDNLNFKTQAQARVCEENKLEETIEDLCNLHILS